MTGLAAPPLIGERQSSNHDCGPAVLAAALQWAGRTDTERQVVDWLVAHGRDSVGTGPGDFAAYCLADGGIPYSWDNGNVSMALYVDEAIAREHVVIGLHQCDGQARPVPRGSTRVAHWRLFYGVAVPNYQTMNPWPPALDTPSISALSAADLHCHFELGLLRPLATPDPPTPEETEVPKLSLFIAKVQGGGTAAFVGDGVWFRHIPGPTPDVANPEPDEAAAVGPWFNGDGLPLRLWSPTPVADVAAFGRPQDEATAMLLDPAWPFP